MEQMRTIVVEGVRIELTEAQNDKVEKEIRRRERCRNSFEKMLKHFGFKKIDTSDWERPNIPAFQHSYYNWYAEIIDHGRWNEVWMAGHGLRHSGFPGGWMYGEPEDIEKELSKALQELAQ
jgi:hypothetical protein